MKKIKYLPLLLLPLIMLACFKPQKRDDGQEIEPPKVDVMENIEKEEFMLIPSAIVASEAWYAVESEEEGVLKWIDKMEQFDELIYLGLEKEWTYKNSNGKTGEGLFYYCEVEKNDEKIHVWLFYNKIRQYSQPGVVLSPGFLYEEDDIMSIIPEEVSQTDLVLVDTEYSDETFVKVRIPKVSESKDYYIERLLVSTHPMDLKVIKVLEKARGFGEGEERVKRELLLTAVDVLGGSELIDILIDEIRKIDTSKDQKPMENKDNTSDEPQEENTEVEQEGS